MRPILLRIPLPWTDEVIMLYGYGAMLCLGCLAAIWVAARRAKRLGQSPEIIYNAALFSFLGGLIGGRLFYVIQYRDHFQSLWDMAKIWDGGLTFYGGFLLAVLLVLGYLAAARLPVLYWLDMIAPSVALGLAFGRMGCFLNGCCFGDVCRIGWGMVWPVGSIPWQHYAEAYQAALPGPAAGGDSGAVLGALAATWRMPAIHPTQLYSIINALLLFAILHLGFRWKRRHGQVIFSFILLYALSRFLREYLRADEAEAFLLGLPTLLRAAGWEEWAWRLPRLTISQNVAIGMALVAGAGLVGLSRSTRQELQADFVPPVIEPTGRRKEKTS
jgi:phosphatidylglycerol:prolipoprotein diacylglycerol transferase